jgi:hypothetical protein
MAIGRGNGGGTVAVGRGCASSIVAMLSERTGNMNGRDTWRMAENGKRKGTEIGETSGRLLRRVCWQDRQEKEGEGRRRT